MTIPAIDLAAPYVTDDDLTILGINRYRKGETIFINMGTAMRWSETPEIWDAVESAKSRGVRVELI